MSRQLKNISGFPEWLPEVKAIEDSCVNTVQRIYESHGFVAIETPAVELLETLTAKGVGDKEIYTLRRLAAEEGDEAELGLHFDLTVPFARYVAAHFNDLVFPFRRYQLQKVWRGERPQKGRFREFYQFDVDIVAREDLPLSCDAEVVSLLGKCLCALNIGTPVLKLNNRKLLIGYYEGIGVQESVIFQVIGVIDKLAKIGVEEVRKQLLALGLSEKTSNDVLEFSGRIILAQDFESALSTLSLPSKLAEEGAKEVLDVLALVSESLLPNIEIQFQIARGLDYYTGTIVESEVREYPEFGSVGSGGRYDGLVSEYLSQRVPGVGVSLGITRIMDLIIKNKIFTPNKRSSAQVLIAVLNEEQRREANEHADDLRSAGINTEVYFKSPKLGKQIDYAAKKGIPHVIFIGESLEVKDITSGEQQSYSSPQELLKIIEQYTCRK
ncbi:MAG: histidine--tRNA ligase [Bdellovibrionales bacterium]|nr:histidine--tRNA ligase [Bdellovibrionales bacterium]